MGIQAPSGLGNVLADEKVLDEVLVDYPVEGPGAGTLTILPAGPPPPNAPALLSSRAMEHVIEDLERRCDLLIIDTPAALAVSDSIPLMRQVSGVVLVARVNRSSRETIRRLHGIITSAGGNFLGVVATGVSLEAGYAHYSTKYYTRNGSKGPAGKRRLRRRRRTEPEPTAVVSD